jgi:hypothetical protein
LKTLMILCAALIVAMLAYQASAGCGRWVVRETTDYLQDPIFDEAVASSTGPNATVPSASSSNQSEERKNDTATDIEPKAARPKAPVIDLSGKWRVMLQQNLGQQSLESSLDLILIQSGDRLQGYGTLEERGAQIPATATGSMSQDNVRLDVKLSRQNKDYRLDLSLINSTLEGSYELYESDKLSEKGDAKASRSGP